MNVSLSVWISFDLAVYGKHCLHYCQPIAEFFALGPLVFFLVTQPLSPYVYTTFYFWHVFQVEGLVSSHIDVIVLSPKTIPAGIATLFWTHIHSRDFLY